MQDKNSIKFNSLVYDYASALPRKGTELVDVVQHLEKITRQKRDELYSDAQLVDFKTSIYRLQDLAEELLEYGKALENCYREMVIDSTTDLPAKATEND